jgi:hypothetical protein
MPTPGVAWRLAETTARSFSGRKPVPGLGPIGHGAAGLPRIFWARGAGGTVVSASSRPPQAADAPPWKSSGGATSRSMGGSLVPQAHHEPPPRRDSPGSGKRLHGSPPASGWAPPLKGDAGSGAGSVRRTSRPIGAVATRSARGSSCVRPTIGPYALPRPASVPDASWRWDAGLAPATQWSWRGGRGLITQRGEPPSSSAPQRVRAVPRGVRAMAWATNRASRVPPCASGTHSRTRPQGGNGDGCVMQQSQAVRRPGRGRCRRQRDG